MASFKQLKENKYLVCLNIHSMKNNMGGKTACLAWSHKSPVRIHSVPQVDTDMAKNSELVASHLSNILPDQISQQLHSVESFLL